jgi:murein DD-endopeptidase MepM/ murein hydrolase activator NlpD
MRNIALALCGFIAVCVSALAQPTPMNVDAPVTSVQLATGTSFDIRNCHWSGNLHEATECTVLLSSAAGRPHAIVPHVVYSSWSADDSHIAIETVDHRVIVYSTDGRRVFTRDGATTPALDAHGARLAVQLVDGGAIEITDLATRDAEKLPLGDEAYAPFFIEATHIGYGSGGAEHVASIWSFDLNTRTSTRLTNRAAIDASTVVEVFPDAAPTVADGVLQYRTEGKLHAISARDGADVPVRAAPESRSWSAPLPDVSSVPTYDMPAQMLESALGNTESDATKTRFRMPIQTYGGIGSFYDHGGLKDWGCGYKSYSGHKGTDFMAPQQTPIVAAAIGSLYDRYDGCPNTGYFGSTCGSGFGNHVRIQHQDGRVTIYGHMYPHTPAWYMSVMCGGQIGRVGMSGSTTGPHVHFEVRSGTNVTTALRLDPFLGRCNAIGSSDWVGQNSAYPSGNVSTSCQ